MTTIILTLAGCASEDYVGDENLHEANDNGRPVSFDLVSAPRTRAIGGGDAADLLDNKFVVYARKTFENSAAQMVFNNYLVQYAENSANTTTSNSAGWEYVGVGYYNVPNGTTDNAGIPTATTNRIEQSVKYWDFAAKKYHFLAYSLGKGDDPEHPEDTKYADATALDFDATNGYTYTLTGSSAQLQACYISNLENKSPDQTSTQVQLKFRKLESKVRIALYETIPGYSVKEVRFYADGGTTASTTASLYGSAATSSGSSAFVLNEGTFTVSFPASPDASVATLNPSLTWQVGNTASSSSLSFGLCESLNANNKWRNWTIREYNEPIADGKGEDQDTIYIGRASSTATISEFQYVLPNPANTANLNLKVDYMLVSRDGYGETITVPAATVTIPAEYAQWLPNYSYTYIFKITDANLYPITLDAVVTQNPDGKQETITTVTEPSITTFGVVGGKYSVGKSEYEVGTDVYATIMHNNSVVTPVLTGALQNVKVYSVAYKSGATDEEKRTNPITENNVANVVGKTGMVIETSDITNIENSIVSAETSVPGEDGSTKNIDALKLTSPDAGIYAVEYTYTDNNSKVKKVYKVITVTAVPVTP